MRRSDGGCGEHDVVDAVALKVGDEVGDEGLVEDRDEGLGHGVGERAEPGATAADQMTASIIRPN